CGGDAIAVRADVTSEDDVTAMVARAVDEFGHVDIMCNNAATPGKDLWIWEQTLDNWNATIAVDVTAGNAMYPRGAESVHAGTPFGRDSELLFDGCLQRDGPQDPLRHGK